MEELRKVIAVCAADKKFVVIDFTASWCGPCKAIAPYFQDLANSPKFADTLLFVKCDVDNAQDVSEWARVSAMPTFQFYKAGDPPVLITEMKGANKEKLLSTVETMHSSVLQERSSAAAAPKKT